jgi:hypothetical protein
MELAVTKLAIICFFITGVSHIVQPRVWAQFFIDMHSKGEVGSFHNALLHFPLGALIASFHNVWHGLPIVLTLIGWGLLLKSFIYFVFPQAWSKNVGACLDGKVLGVHRRWRIFGWHQRLADIFITRKVKCVLV